MQLCYGLDTGPAFGSFFVVRLPRIPKAIINTGFLFINISTTFFYELYRFSLLLVAYLLYDSYLHTSPPLRLYCTQLSTVFASALFLPIALYFVYRVNIRCQMTSRS